MLISRIRAFRPAYTFLLVSACAHHKLPEKLLALNRSLLCVSCLGQEVQAGKGWFSVLFVNDTSPSFESEPELCSQKNHSPSNLQRKKWHTILLVLRSCAQGEGTAIMRVLTPYSRAPPMESSAGMLP